MKVFLGWSGQASRDCARCLREWLPLVVPRVEPWFSQEDIEKGSEWRDELDRALADAGWGIFCLVGDHLPSSWLSFEAGRLAGKRVSPLLFDCGEEQLPDPLKAFQVTRFEKQDVYRLVRDLESAAPTKERATPLERAFEYCWPGLEAEIGFALKGEKPAAAEADRPARGSLEEAVLELLRNSPGQGASEVAARLRITEGDAAETLRRLTGAGLLESQLVDPLKNDLRFWVSTTGQRLLDER